MDGIFKWIFFVVLLMVSNLSSAGNSSSNAVEYQDKCRYSGGIFLEPLKFSAFSCAACYRHMSTNLFFNNTKLVHYQYWLFDVRTGEQYEPDFENSSSPIFDTFKSPEISQLWVDCCRAANECCRIMRTTFPTTDPDGCPRTWDGWHCWLDTPRGTTIENQCPSHIYFNSDPPLCNRYATKQCLENGTWYRNKIGNEYSDYTTCGQSKDIKLLLITHVITFGVSIIFLLPAIGIFFYYRPLKVHRIFMHKNLFMSLLFTAIFVIVFQSYFMLDSIENPNSSTVKANLASCKVFYSITKYLRLTSYAWMFCEGFYLHKLIVAAFAEQKSMLVFHIVGWGFPIIPVTIWALVRHSYADEMCWTVPTEHFEWILFTPMLAALLANFGFLAHIIQVLITKLRSSHTDEPSQFRRAVRATMVLIPLFGLHFLLLSYHPAPKNCYSKKVYDILTFSMDGLQGGIVSVIFCYLNKEVLFLLKRSYNRQKMIRDVGSQAGSRRIRESRTSVSTNVDSFANDCNTVVSRTLKK